MKVHVTSTSNLDDATSVTLREIAETLLRIENLLVLLVPAERTQQPDRYEAATLFREADETTQFDPDETVQIRRPR